MKLKDDLNIGLGIGILLPTLVFFCLYGANEIFHLPFKLRTIALLALCLNILPLRNFSSTKMRKLTRGVVISTFLLCIIWVIWFMPEILHEL